MGEKHARNIPLIVILGPTASGKSSFAIQLALEYGGEIVSADSRQVYRGLDIGSGKVSDEEQSIVRHHLIDVADPGTRFTVADYKVLADAAISTIYKRGTIPFLVGGSSLYADVVVENYQIPPANFDAQYRLLLDRRNIDELLDELKMADPVLYKTIDRHNKRRIIRALEVFHLTGMPLSSLKMKGESIYNVLLLGVDLDRKELYRKIDDRVDIRIKQGMLEEVEHLLKLGIPFDWLKNLGLEYRICTEYLLETDKSERAFEESIQKLKYAIHDFARRQLIWLRKNTLIHWCVTLDDMRSQIETFLTY